MTIDDGKIVVGCSAENGSCASCAGHAFCSVKGRSYEVSNPENLSLAPGDFVDIYLPPGRTILTGFLVLIVPLLLFLLFFILSGRLFDIRDEGIRALAGLAGMAAGFAGTFLYSRKNRRITLPVILRKI